MQQNIPKNENGLLSRSALAIYGATKHALTINLAYNNAAAVTLRRGAAIDARDAHDAGIVELRNLRLALELKAAECRTFASLTRDLFRPVLGRKYSQAWAGTGFTNKLVIPVPWAGLETLLESNAGFLTDHPERESDSSGVTAAAATALHGELRTLRLAVEGKEADLRTLAKDRRAKFAALRRCLLKQAQELKQIIPEDDNRWLDYGLNIPALLERPETPTNIQTMLIGGNIMSVKWDKSARAEYYRVWMRIVGTGTVLDVVGSPSDPDFAIQPVPANSVLEIALSALNNGGESPRSEVITVQTP